MRKSLVLIVSLAFLTFVSSCEKNDDNDTDNTTCPAPPLAGLWIGSYTVNQLPSAGTIPMNFIFKPDGKLVTESKGADGRTYYSAGTWTLSGTTLNCTYISINFSGPQVTQSANFTFNSANTTLSGGTWADVANGSNYTGTFPTMARVN